MGASVGEAGDDMLVVQQRIEGFPVCESQVRCPRGRSVERAALGAPAQLLGVGQAPKVVDGDVECGQN